MIVTKSKCQCGKPASWMLRVVAVPDGVMRQYAHDSWASCDAHLQDSAEGLLNRNKMEGKVLVLRKED